MPLIMMANTGLCAWALRINGWGGIGLSFILMAFIFNKCKYEKLSKNLFIVNGVSSCLSALMTLINMNKLLSSGLFTPLIIWNIFLFVVDLIFLITSKS